MLAKFTGEKKGFSLIAQMCVNFAFLVCRCNIEGEVYGGAVTLWWGRYEGALMKAVQGHYGINNHFSQKKCFPHRIL